MSLASISSALETAAAAATQVEQLSAVALAQTGSTPSNAQKLQAALSIASAVNPTIGADAAAATLLINALVGVFNLFGIFKRAPAATVAG